MAEKPSSVFEDQWSLQVDVDGDRTDEPDASSRGNLSRVASNLVTPAHSHLGAGSRENQHLSFSRAPQSKSLLESSSFDLENSNFVLSRTSSNAQDARTHYQSVSEAPEAKQQ
jgi:hypothetical protein